MTALQKIFQGYYDRRIEGEEPDPEGMRKVHKQIIDSLQKQHIEYDDTDDIMLLVSRYGTMAEETGFYAGFQMAWELLKSMQEETEKK